MYNLIKADEIYKKRLEENPKYDHELVCDWRKNMPEQFAKKMYEDEYGCHIYTKEMYDEAVSLLVWAEHKGEGPKWEFEEIIKISDIDFSTKDYYEYDYAYVMNMLWSDYCNVFTETSYYKKMAKDYLEDPDYMGKADERAYHNAMKRIKYFEKK